MTSALVFVSSAVTVLAAAAAAGAVAAGPPPRRHPTSESARRSSRAVPRWIVDLVEVLGPSVLRPEALWSAIKLGAPLALAGVGLLLGPAPAAVLGCGMALVPRLAGRASDRRRRARRDAQLAPALDRLASSLRAGRSPSGSLAEVAGDLGEPLGTELVGIAAAIGHGDHAGPAIRRWQTAAGPSPDVDLVATALEVGFQTGGQLGRLVDGVAATLRERQELRAEMRGLATQARASAGLLAVAPLGFTALVGSVEPDVVRFLTTNPIGVACLTAGLGLEALGALWMRQIMDRSL